MDVVLPDDARIIELPGVVDAVPGFRCIDGLTDTVAISAMIGVCRNTTNDALRNRLALLELGFSTAHSLCRELDEVARAFSGHLVVLQRQLLSLDAVVTSSP